MAATPKPDDAQDEIKRKFREALERKQGKHGDKVAGDEAGDAGRVPHAHGPAKSQRTFRRKSGG